MAPERVLNNETGADIKEFKETVKTSEHTAPVKPVEHKKSAKKSEENNTAKTSEQKETAKSSEQKESAVAKQHKDAPIVKEAAKIETEIPEVPVTKERKPYLRTEEDKLIEPGIPRATIAATNAQPNGTTKDDWAKKHRHQTVLQQHCDFFDRDHDGIIWPQDTFVGFYRLGFGVILSIVAVLIIHLNFAYPTQKSWIPDPRLLVNINNIHKDKHGGDTGSYDHEGRFVPQHFEETFTKYAEGRDYLTLRDLGKIWNGQRLLNDFPGMGAAIFEWFATYVMLWPKDGKLWKEDLRGIYDGSIFYTIAERREAGKQK